MKDKIETYLILRAQQAEVEALLKSVKDKVSELGAEILNDMDAIGATQLEGSGGEKLSVVRSRYINITDFEAFRFWCEQNGSQDLLKLTFDRGLTNELCFGLAEANMPLPDGVEIGCGSSLRLYKARNGNNKSIVEVIEDAGKGTTQ